MQGKGVSPKGSRHTLSRITMSPAKMCWQVQRRKNGRWVVIGLIIRIMKVPTVAALLVLVLAQAGHGCDQARARLPGLRAEVYSGVWEVRLDAFTDPKFV
jgi:hypothetical protein